jgi:hypothetical protein
MPFKQQSRLSPEQVHFIMKMKNVKYSNLEIAQKMGVTEGAIRYQIKRQESGLADGRKIKDSMLDRYNEILCYWTSEYEGGESRPSLKIFYDNLREYHGYSGSYDALRRYIRKKFPEFLKKRSHIRLETPPGALVQVDWKEGIPFYIGSLETPVKLNALVITLCFSRKMAVIFSEKKDLDAFIACHQRGFLKLGGLVKTERTDCLKSAVVRWNGSQTILNERYRKYLSELGVEAFPSRPGTPTDKGKVEKRIGDFFRRLDLKHKVYPTLEALELEADAKLEELEKGWRCGATGLSVSKSFEYEKGHLKRLPSHFPVLPVAEKVSMVRKDGTVYFYDNYYQVESSYIGRQVLCLHTGLEIVIYCDGEEIERHKHLPGTKGMLRLSEKALREEGVKLSPRVREWGLEVAGRQVSIYQEIINQTGGLR